MSKTHITAEPGIPHIIITREFDAPSDLVFRAHIEPERRKRILRGGTKTAARMVGLGVEPIGRGAGRKIVGHTVVHASDVRGFTGSGHDFRCRKTSGWRRCCVESLSFDRFHVHRLI